MSRPLRAEVGPAFAAATARSSRLRPPAIGMNEPGPTITTATQGCRRLAFTSNATLASG